jgi:hypothetical protein
VLVFPGCRCPTWAVWQGSVLEAIQRGRRNGNCGSLRRRFSTTNRRFWILDCRFWITNFRPPARQRARGDSQRPPVGIAVTLRRRFSTTSHAGTANSSCEELSRCPELFSSLILPTWLRIPIVILAILGGMRENFVDYNIFWGGPQKSPPLSSSAPSPLFDSLVRLAPAPLPQGAKSEGLTNTGRDDLFPSFLRCSVSSSDFFCLHPKKAPLF